MKKIRILCIVFMIGLLTDCVLLVINAGKPVEMAPTKCLWNAPDCFLSPDEAPARQGNTEG